MEQLMPVQRPLNAVSPQKKLRMRQRLERLWPTLVKFRLGVISGLFLLVLVLVSILAPAISPHDPFDAQILMRLKPPAWEAGGSSEYWLGTDGLGRDVVSRLIFAARVSLAVSVLASLVSAVVGVLLGLAAGYMRGYVDALISTLVNIMLTFPFILLALAVIAALGSGIANVILVLGISGWPTYTRLVRADVMRIHELEYIAAARVVGVRDSQIVFRHILPNLLNGVIVLTSIQVARVIISEAFLSFLGLGIKPPIPTWGNMLGESTTYMFDRWWLPTFPGIAIFVTTLAINLFGDTLRDYFDPRGHDY